jgi:hypothetical protein
MNRMVVAVLVLGACGKSGGSGGGGSGSAGSGGGSAGSAAPTPIDGNELTKKVVTQAFGGKVPAFPLLSSSGIAAIGLETPLRLSEGSTYSVVFLPTGAGGPWDQVETTPIVDAMLAKLLTEGSPDGTTEPIYDRDGLASRALAAKDRIDREKFTAFEGVVDPVVRDQAAMIGPVFLEQKATESGLQIQLADPSGVVHATDNVANVQTAMVAGEECLAKPTVTRAWFDKGRKRVLVELGWVIAEVCVPPEQQYRLYALH